MEGVTNEKEMTQGQLMKEFDAATRRYARPITGKYTTEQLKAQVGKETGVIFKYFDTLTVHTHAHVDAHTCPCMRTYAHVHTGLDRF